MKVPNWLSVVVVFSTSFTLAGELETGGGLDETVAAGKGARRVGEVVVDVANDGAISVEDRAMTKEELEETLSIIERNYRDQLVIISGARDAAFEHIVAVMNVCQRAGIWNIALATQSPKEPILKGDPVIVWPKFPPGGGRLIVAMKIAPDGGLSLEGQAKTLVDLEKGLVALLERWPKLSVIIGVGRDGKSARFVEVTNVLARLKITWVTTTGRLLQDSDE